MNMDERRAREVVADYLVGRPVAQEALRAACETLKRQAPDALLWLRGEMGVCRSEPEANWCHAVREQLAEYADLPPAQREKEMPGVTRHVRDCPRCRQDLRELASAWRSVMVGAKTATTSMVRVLWMGLRLSWERRTGAVRGDETCDLAYGELAMAGAGLLDAKLLKSAEKPALGPDVRREWVVSDPERGVTFHLALWSQPGAGHLTVALTARGLPAPTRADQSKIAILDRATGREEASHPVRDWAKCEFPLPPGGWLIDVVSRYGDREDAWRIPLEVEQGT